MKTLLSVAERDRKLRIWDRKRARDETLAPTEINSKMYTSFIGVWILQEEIIFGHFSADDMVSDKHHMNDCLILENGSGDIMEKQNKT